MIELYLPRYGHICPPVIVGKYVITEVPIAIDSCRFTVAVTHSG